MLAQLYTRFIQVATPDQRREAAALIGNPNVASSIKIKFLRSQIFANQGK
jgi:hypothetical protein